MIQNDTIFALSAGALSPLSLLAPGIQGLSAGRRRTPDKTSTSPTPRGSTAVITIEGVISQRPAAGWPIAGTGTPLNWFSATFRSALADSAVASILIDIDSPGGEFYGVQEAADLIYRSRSQKRIVALANSVAGSGAYWIGAAASEFYVTPGGEVGGLGLYQAHVDRSRLYAKKGVKQSVISAGKYKTEALDTQPLSPETRKFMQSRVDGAYSKMVSSIASFRRTDPAAVRKKFGEGRMVGASAAASSGMVDGVATFDQLLAELNKGRSPSFARSAFLADSVRS